MLHNIAAGVLVLGVLVLGVGLWGRFWVRNGGLGFLQPMTRIALVVAGAFLIFSGYWNSFGGVFGKPATPKVWTASGALPSGPPAASPAAPVPAPAAAPLELYPDAEPSPAATEPVQADSSPAAESPQTPAPESAEPAAAAAPAAPLPPAVTTAAPVTDSARSESAQEAPPPVAIQAQTPKARRSKAGLDERVDVCAVQKAYGIRTEPRQASRIVIRNALGPGQVREKLSLRINGRKLAEFNISRKKPSVQVSLDLPKDPNSSYSLSGYTEYENGLRREVSGGGWLEAGVHRYDVRSTPEWDARGGEVFLEAAP